MPILPLLGNDVVDLNSAGIAGKCDDIRFLNRVFSNSEQSEILSSSNPDLTLWMFWAAKETAFKIISKIIGPPVFVHKQFEIKLLPRLSQSKQILEVCYEKWIVEIEISLNKNYIHAVGTYKQIINMPGAVIIKKVIQPAKAEFLDWENKLKWHENFSTKECVSIHKAESALVRYYCKNSIAGKLKIEPSRLQIIRPEINGKSQPPFLMIDNKCSEIDISLSHHGNRIGWCFSLPRIKSAPPPHIYPFPQ